MEAGRVAGEEGARGSRFTGGSVQTCQKAGPTRSWAPGSRELASSAQEALAGLGDRSQGLTLEWSMEQSREGRQAQWPPEAAGARAGPCGGFHLWKLQTRVETAKLEIPLNFL